MDEAELFISLNECARRTSIAARTLRAKVKDPTAPLPAIKVGGRLVFQWGAVKAWLEEHRVKPVDVKAKAERVAKQVVGKPKPSQSRRRRRNSKSPNRRAAAKRRTDS